MCQGVIHTVSTHTHTQATDGRQYLATHSEEATHTHIYTRTATFKSLGSWHIHWKLATLVALLSLSMKTHTHCNQIPQIPPLLLSHFKIFPSSQHRTNSYKYTPYPQYIGTRRKWILYEGQYVWENTSALIMWDVRSSWWWGSTENHTERINT